MTSNANPSSQKENRHNRPATNDSGKRGGIGNGKPGSKGKNKGKSKGGNQLS